MSITFGKIIGFILVLMVIAVGAYTFLRPETEVAWEMFVSKLDKAIGEEEVEIKRLESRLDSLEEKWKRQIFAKHQLQVQADSLTSAASNGNASLLALQSKANQIEQILAKQEPYKGTSGTIYTPKQLVDLLAQLKREIEMESARVDGQQQRANEYSEFASTAKQLQDKTHMTLTELRSQLTALHEKRNDLQILREQVDIAKDLTSDYALNYDSIISEFKRTSIMLDAKIKANDELLATYMKAASQPDLNTILQDF